MPSGPVCAGSARWLPEEGLVDSVEIRMHVGGAHVGEPLGLLALGDGDDRHHASADPTANVGGVIADKDGGGGLDAGWL